MLEDETIIETHFLVEAAPTNSGDDELVTLADCDKFVESFEDNYPGVCDGRSVWLVDRRYMLVEAPGS